MPSYPWLSGAEPDHGEGNMAWILNGKNPIITNEAEDTFKVVFHKIGRKSDIIKELTKIIQSNESPDIVSIAKFLLGDDKKATKYF